jgi:hypothetical protein
VALQGRASSSASVRTSNPVEVRSNRTGRAAVTDSWNQQPSAYRGLGPTIRGNGGLVERTPDPRLSIRPSMTKRITAGFAWLFAFGVGCGAGVGAANLVVPPARAGTNPQRWEYQCVEERQPETVTAAANKLGAQGFELASAAGVGGYELWCFKRPLP